MLREIFDLVGVDVRRRRLDRRGQIQDDRLVGGRLEDIHHRGAAFDAEIQFGGRKGFRAIFETPVGAGQARGIVAKLDRKSVVEGKGGEVRVKFWGGRILKKKK